MIKKMTASIKGSGEAITVCTDIEGKRTIWDTREGREVLATDFMEATWHKGYDWDDIRYVDECCDMLYDCPVYDPVHGVIEASYNRFKAWQPAWVEK